MFARLSVSGAELLSHTVSLIEKGEAKAIKQDESKVSFAPMLTKEEAKIDWSMPAAKIINAIRGYDPWPAAYSTVGGTPVKLFRAVRADGETYDGSGRGGTIAGIKKGEGIRVVCGDGKCIIIKELQAAGSKRMSAEDYFRGHQEKLNANFE